MLSTTHRTIGPLAIAGGALWALMGAVQATHGDFGGTHNTIDSTAEYLVTASFGGALALTAPLYALLGRLAGKPKVGIAAVVALTVLSLMSFASVLTGEDAAFFNAVAPLCLLTWFASSVVLAVLLKRRGVVATPVAVALGLLVPVTMAGSVIGLSILTGAFLIAVGAQLAKQPHVQPALA